MFAARFSQSKFIFASKFILFFGFALIFLVMNFSHFTLIFEFIQSLNFGSLLLISWVIYSRLKYLSQISQDCGS